MKATMFFALIVLGMSAVSCGYKKYSEQLTSEKQELAVIVNDRDSTINELNDIIGKIHSDLESLTDQQKELTLLDVKEHYGEEEKQLIESINTLMQNNRDKIKSLQQRLSQMNSNIRNVKELNKQIDELNEKLTLSESDIQQLNQRVAGLNDNISLKNVTVDSLKAANSAKDGEIVELNQRLHEAYYVIGDKNMLKDNNIIVKKGGFLGLGRVEEIMPAPDKSHFTEIDTRKTTKITLPREFDKIELISVHPAESYTIDSNELAIVKPEEFWESSRYLVIKED